jgi:hypothetical protein
MGYEYVGTGACVSEREAESLKAARIDLSPITDSFKLHKVYIDDDYRGQSIDDIKPC